MPKLICDLQIGDKIFVINKSDCTFDVAEVTGLLNLMIRFQSYLNNELFYLWKYQESKHETYCRIVFTDEYEAIKEFEFILKHNQNGSNR